MIANPREGRAWRGSPNIGPLTRGCPMCNLLVEAIVEQVRASREVNLVDSVAHLLQSCCYAILPGRRAGEKYEYFKT